MGQTFKEKTYYDNYESKQVCKATEKEKKLTRNYKYLNNSIWKKYNMIIVSQNKYIASGKEKKLR